MVPNMGVISSHYSQAAYYHQKAQARDNRGHPLALEIDRLGFRVYSGNMDYAMPQSAVAE